MEGALHDRAKDAPELAAIASELGDMKLLMELERRGLRFTEPLVKEEERIADEITFRYRIPVGLQAQVALTPAALDESGDGLVADRLIELLVQAYGAEGRATIIGVTDYDMDSPTHDHVFTLRAGRNYAIVSTAQLSASILDRLQGDSRHGRTRKLVARNIGFLYLGLPESADRRSLVRSSMSSVGDIDDLEEEF